MFWQTRKTIELKRQWEEASWDDEILNSGLNTVAIQVASEIDKLRRLQQRMAPWQGLCVGENKTESLHYEKKWVQQRITLLETRELWILHDRDKKKCNNLWRNYRPHSDATG